MTLSISARMRFTSDRPSSWICCGVLSVVVCHLTLYAYSAAPLVSAFAAVVARPVRHERERSGNILLHTIELVERHEQVARYHAANRDRVVLEVEPLDGRLQQLAVKIEVQLIGGVELRAIEAQQPLTAALQM